MPTHVHLTVRATPEEAKSIALAAAIEGKSKSAWMLALLAARATVVVSDHYSRGAGT